MAGVVIGEKRFLISIPTRIAQSGVYDNSQCYHVGDQIVVLKQEKIISNWVWFDFLPQCEHQDILGHAITVEEFYENTRPRAILEEE